MSFSGVVAPPAFISPSSDVDPSVARPLGEKVAQYASKHLHKVVVRRPEYEKGRVAEALQQACLEIDRMMLADEVLKDDLAGTTAVSVLIRHGTLYCVSMARSNCVGKGNHRKTDTFLRG